MISQDQAKTLIDTALRHAKRKKVDGIEVTVTASDIATSRFANNGMTQNQSPQLINISLRVQKDGKQARLSSDQITPAAIKSLVDNALLAAGFLEKDPDILPLPKPQKRGEQKTVNRYDARTASFTPAQRATEIKTMIEIAKDRGLSAAGVYATGTWVQAIGNSEGLLRYHRETSAECSVTIKHVDPATGSESTGWAKLHSTKAADINAAEMATRAAHKAVASANPSEVAPGRYTVILEPSAVLDLMCFLWYDFTATSHADKLSSFLGKVGQVVVGSNIDVTDDPHHRLQSGSPFDGEGLQRKPLTLLENGKLAHLLANRRNALKMHIEATGHGSQEPSAEGEWAQNIVMAGGDTSLEDMIRSTERGILLTRVWYVREVDPTTKIVTGMTRDGTFLIEDGAVKCGIKNMRFNQSLIEMLHKVVALSPSVRAAGEEGSPAVVPAIKVEDFLFSSVTRF